MLPPSGCCFTGEKEARRMFSLSPYFGCLDWNGAVKLQSEKKGKGEANAENRQSRRRLHVVREGAPEVNSELIDTQFDSPFRVACESPAPSGRTEVALLIPSVLFVEETPDLMMCQILETRDTSARFSGLGCTMMRNKKEKDFQKEAVRFKVSQSKLMSTDSSPNDLRKLDSWQKKRYSTKARAWDQAQSLTSASKQALYY
ncbi:uncharacterized protein LOC121442856 [Microtus oregoni]|uniref:uncharacterized protein LOC121442856 n=1 Tax=Microtus oregoni TaxID=111838 RepID=UPI001BB1FFF4|nr:uncharacterized protein LOC121442856 [Microtus oregoni]